MTSPRSPCLQSVDDLRQILDSLYGFVCVVSLDAVVEEVNEALLAILGCARHEVIGRRLHDIGWIAAESRPEAERALAAASQGATVRKDVLGAFLGTGRRIVDAVFRPGRDAAGEIVRIIVFGTDTTERRRVDALLAESEERLRLSLSAAGQGIYDLDLVTGEAQISVEYAAMLGYDPATFRETNERWLDRLHPDDTERVCALFRDYVAGRIPHYEVEFRQKTAAGGWLWILSKGSTVAFDDHGRPTRMLGTHTNIDVRKRAEEELRRSESRLREAQRIAMLGNWELDRRTGELVWSDEVYRIFEVDKAAFEPSYEAFLGLVHPEDRAMVDAAYARSVETGMPYSIVHRLLFADGRVKHVHEQGETRYDAHGSPLQSAGTVLDVTERVRTDQQVYALKAQLAHATRLGTLGEIAAGLAHELNQPLTSLRLYSSVARTLAGDAASPALSDVLERIDEQAVRAGEIIGRMRAFASRGAPKRRIVAVNSLVKEVFAILEHEVRHGRVALDMALSPEDPFVEADAIQIQQVVVNLVRNAIDAMPAAGAAARHLSLCTIRSGQQVEVRIDDTDTGIDAGIAERLFTPFTSSKEAGLGLGLVICKSIVEAHGGRIGLEPRPVGGTRAWFSLPRAESSAERTGSAGV